MVALATFLGLLLAEGVLRVFGLAPSSGVTTVTESEFRRVPGLFTPSVRVRVTQNPNLPHTVTVNALGYRGAEVAREKPPGEIRVFFAGDSFVFGDFVEDDQSYPARLEAALRESCPAARVVNAGVGGTSIVTHANMIRRGLPLDPDLVLLNFTENDVGDLAAEPMWDQLARNRAAKSRFPLGLVYPVLRNTATWQLLLRARGLIRARETDAAMEVGGEGGQPGPPRDPALRARYAEEFSEVAAELRRLGIPFLSTAFPAHLSVYGEWETEQLDWFEGVAGSSGVPFIPILEALRASGLGETELYLLPWDGHPGPPAYELAARTMARAILDGGFLEGCGVAEAP